MAPLLFPNKWEQDRNITLQKWEEIIGASCLPIFYFSDSNRLLFPVEKQGMEKAVTVSMELFFLI